MTEQLSFPTRVELAELTADELQALTPEQCLALLPEYTVDELDALKSAYFDEWMNFTNYFLDHECNLPEEQVGTRQARVREVYRRHSFLNDFHWWKKSNATIDDIKAAFERRREMAEASRRYDEEWKARDAADLAAGKEYAVWHKLMAEQKAKNL